MQDEQEKRGVRCACVCVLFSTPLVFIAGSHGVRLLQPTSATSGEATRGEVEAVGPMGQVGRPVGRSTCRSVDLPGGPTAPCFVQQDVLGLLVSSTLGLAYLGLSELGYCITFGPSEPESVL